MEPLRHLRPRSLPVAHRRRRLITSPSVAHLEGDLRLRTDSYRAARTWSGPARIATSDRAADTRPHRSSPPPAGSRPHRVRSPAALGPTNLHTEVRRISP